MTALFGGVKAESAIQGANTWIFVDSDARLQNSWLMVVQAELQYHRFGTRLPENGRADVQR